MVTIFVAPQEVVKNMFTSVGLLREKVLTVITHFKTKGWITGGHEGVSK